MTTLFNGDLVKKDPNATNWPRGVNWTKYLAKLDDDEIIVSSTWDIVGHDALLTKDSGSIVDGSRKTQVKLSGGTRGRRYVVTNSIVTSSGVNDDASFVVFIQDE